MVLDIIDRPLEYEPVGMLQSDARQKSFNLNSSKGL